MMAFLAMPAVIVGLVGALGLGAFWVQDFFEDRGFRNRIDELTTQVEKMQATYAHLQVSEQAEKTNVANLQKEIAQMNARLDAINARARQVEATANARVARALREGQEAAAGLRAETTRVPPGHVEMNSWLTERLGS